MKFILSLVLTVFILYANGYKLAPYGAVNCSTNLAFINKLQTTLLDLDRHSDKDLMTCIIKTIHFDQSILLVGGNNTRSNPILRKTKTTSIPNIIILTKRITLDVASSPSVKRLFRLHHRSLVYVIITDDNKFKCKNGTFNTSDISSLEDFMNNLWLLYKVMHVVVTFPLSCQEKVALYSDKKYTNEILYNRTIKLIDSSNTEEIYATVSQDAALLTEGYPLRANIFFRYPTSITECENLHYYTNIDLNLTEGFCGLDALLMHDIVKHFKFSLHVPEDSICDKYGYVMPKNITGSLGCIIRREMDFSFNSRFMTMYSEHQIYYLYYVSTDSLCAIIKRASKIPIWHYAFSVYDANLWLLIMSLTLVVGVCMWVVAALKNKITDENKEYLWFNIEDTFTSMLLGFSLKKKGKLYLMRGTCLFSSLLFVAIYQGHINHMFTTLIRYETIKTLDSLYKSDNILYVSPSIRELLRQLEKPENKPQRDFIQRSRRVPENYRMDFINRYPHAALMGRKQDSVLEILSEYINKDGSPMMDIVDECFYTYYLSYIARTGFPFFEELQRFMQRVVEAGLPTIYYKWTYNMLGVPQSFPKARSEPRPFAKIELQDQRVAFGILFFGIMLSLIVFAIELLRGKHK